MVSSCGGGAVNRRRLRPLFRGAGCFLPSISCIRALSRDSSLLGLFLPSHRASVNRPNCPTVPTKNEQTLKPSSARPAHPFTTRTPARSTNSGNMAAEQNEKAYQKQLGVNVGCVSQPRLNPRASPARASPCFFPPHRERQALTPSRLSSLPTASAPRARRRVPARTVPATTRTSVLASRPRVRLSRVSRPHRDRQARSGVALDFQGSLGLEAAPRFLGSRRAARGPARGRTWTRFVCESRHTPRLDRPRPSRPVRRAIAPRRARRWGPCQPPHPAPRAASQR